MNTSKKLFILSILIMVCALWFVALYFFKDEYMIILTIFFGLVFLVGVFVYILEEINPKNKLSKRLEKLIEWIFDNINLG